MKDLQRILEDCLKRLSKGTASLDECLRRYPEQAEQLEPLLKTTLLLNSKPNLMPSPTFNAFGRFALIRFAKAHPRQPRGIALSWRTAMATLVLAFALLVTGTVHAQSAMPGDTYYEWKRTSELAWRAVAPNSVAVDIALSERRLAEWIAVADDPVLGVSAKENYQAALSRLDSNNNEENFGLIVAALQSQQQALNSAGLSTLELDELLASLQGPFIIPVTGSGTETLDGSDSPVGECPPYCGNGNANGVGKDKGDEKGNKGGSSTDKGNKGGNSDNKGSQNNNGNTK